jgi:hypothetical protein
MERKDELALPDLKMGEKLHWSYLMSAKDLCFLEIGTGLFLLVNCFGWLAITFLVMFAVVITEAKIDLSMFAFLVSGAIVGYVVLWTLVVIINDFFISGAERYAITDRRVIRVDRTNTKELLLDSATLRVMRFQTFNESGIIIFRDIQQPHLVIVVCCKDKIDEIMEFLPPQLRSGKNKLSNYK